MITDLASGWKQWFADDFSVSVTFPGDYRVVKAVSEGADLSCHSGNGNALLEVLRWTNTRPLEKDLVDVLVDGYYRMAEIPMYQNWRVVSREDVDAGEAARAVRFECAFTEQGHPMYMILLFRGRGGHAANVALKAVAADREENAPVFERILDSFETLYLTAPFESAPDDFLARLSPEERRLVGDLQPGMCEAAIAARESGRKVRFFDTRNPSGASGTDDFEKLSVPELQRLAESVNLSTEATGEPDQERAGELFHRAFELNPYDDTSIISYAITLSRQGEMRGAMKWAARAIAVNPSSARTRENYEVLRAQIADVAVKSSSPDFFAHRIDAVPTKCCACDENSQDDAYEAFLRLQKAGRGNNPQIKLVPIRLCSRCRYEEIKGQANWQRDQNAAFFGLGAMIWGTAYAFLYRADMDLPAFTLASGLAVAVMIGVLFVRRLFRRMLRRESRILKCSAAVAAAKLMKRDGWGLSDVFVQFS